MTIKAIYEKYKIPPNLAEHMLRVAKVALFICDHWRGPKINRDLVIKGALLHDLGNIVKFKFAHLPSLIPAEKEKYWKEVQKDMARRYGQDAHRATRAMASELGIKGRLLDVLAVGWEEVSEDWEKMIILYADSRIDPLGMVSLVERLEDIRKRYGEETFGRIATAARERERKLQENLDVPVSKITEESIARSDQELLNTEI